MRLRREIERYLIAQKQAGLSPATLRQYKWHLERLAEYWDGQAPHIEGDDRTLRDCLREWGAGLGENWSPASVKQAICACRSLFAWLVEESVLDTNPALALKVPRVPMRVQRTVTADEVRAMLGMCDDSSLKGIRDCALITLLIDTGLRAAEVCRLRVGDLRMDLGCLAVVGKGGDEDLAYFGEETTRAVRAWLEVRVAAPGVKTLFTAIGGLTPGQPLTTRGLRIIVKQIGDRAGLEGISPHAFRRGFACIATEAGAPTRTVMLAGRWSNIDMVVRYTQALQRGRMHGRWSPADVVNGRGDPAGEGDP